MDTKKDIKSLNLEELKTELESMGEKAFRAKQMDACEAGQEL